MKTLHLIVRYVVTHPTIRNYQRVDAVLILLGKALSDENFITRLMEDAGAL